MNSPWTVSLLVLAAGLRAGTVVTLPEAGQEMSQRHPQRVAAREALTAAQARQRAAWGDYFPQLSAFAAYNRGAEGTAFDLFGSDSYDLGFSLRQNLFDGLRTQAGVELQRARVDSTRADVDRVVARLSSDLKTAFSDLVFAQENHRLATATLGRRQDNLDLVELRFEGGREHKGSYLRIKAAHRQAGFDLAQADRDRGVARARLARLMGRDLGEVLVATGAVNALPPPARPDFSVLAQATPDYVTVEANARAAQAERALARGGFLPTLDASLTQHWLEDQWPPSDRSWSGGVFLSLPLFHGGARRQGYRASQADLRRAEALRADTFNQTFIDLQSAWAGFQDAWEQVGVQREFLDAAEVRALISRSQYTSGLLSFEDWDLIENDLISARKQWLAVQRDALRAEAAWENAQGKGWIP